MGCPTALIAALVGNVEKAPVKLPLVIGAVHRQLCNAIAVNKPEFAIRDLHCFRLALWPPVTDRTWLPFEPHRMAFRASRESRGARLCPCGMSRVFGALARGKGPAHRLLDKAVLEHSAGMIEDQRIRFARR